MLKNPVTEKNLPFKVHASRLKVHIDNRVSPTSVPQDTCVTQTHKANGQPDRQKLQSRSQTHSDQNFPQQAQVPVPNQATPLPLSQSTDEQWHQVQGIMG